MEKLYFQSQFVCLRFAIFCNLYSSLLISNQHKIHYYPMYETYVFHFWVCWLVVFFLLGAVASFEDVAWVDLMSVGLRVFIHRIADWASVHLLLPQTSLLLLRLHTIIFIIFFFLGGGSNGKRSAQHRQHRFVQTHKCTTSIFNFYERTESSSTMDPSVLTFKKKTFILVSIKTIMLFGRW